MAHRQTLQDVLHKAVELLCDRGISEPKLSAEILFAKALQCKRIDLYLNFDQSVQENDLDIFRGFIRRRLKNEPVQYIVGETEFYGLPFQLNPSVLIPRPETEILIEQVVEFLKKGNTRRHLLDIGTGSGNIPITICRNIDEVTFDAIDISDEALLIAKTNAERHSVNNRIDFIHADIFDDQSVVMNRQYDIITSNPPYISKDDIASLQPEVKDFEPHHSYSDDADGLRFYKRIAEVHQLILKTDGMIAVEIGFGQKDDVKTIFQNSGLKIISIHQDYSQIDRVIIASR